MRAIEHRCNRELRASPRRTKIHAIAVKGPISASQESKFQIPSPSNAETKPPIGEVVLIGQMAGRVARHHESGIGIEFVGSPHERASVERMQTKLSVVR